MKTTTHICDLCKTSVSEEHLAHLRVQVDNRKGLTLANTGYNGIEIDICKKCLEKKGFIVERKEEENVKQIELTNLQKLEEVFVSWLSDLGVMFEE